MIKPFFFDIEVFPNYFLLDIYQDGKHWTYENPVDVAQILDRARDVVLCGFNNKAYDDIILTHIWQGNTDVDSIYELSSKLISGTDWEEMAQLKFARKPWGISVDMFQILNKKAGLKEWECHIHYPTVVEAGVSFTAPLPADKVQEIRLYCRNDVEATAALYERNRGLIDVRIKLQEKFGVSNRVFAMGDARMAEEILISNYLKRSGKVYSKIKEDCAENLDNLAESFDGVDLILPCVQYQTDEFKSFRDVFVRSKIVKENDAWKLQSPLDGVRHIRGANERDVRVPWFNSIILAGRQITVGVGGLHTQDDRGSFVTDEEFEIIDADVTSYYPSLIVKHGLAPAHIEGFVEDYARILGDRVAAKAKGDKITADAYKLVANSTYGKFNEKFSLIRSVKSAFQITLNGQLMILMLVERLHLAGVDILSANTDGVTIRKPKLLDISEVFKQWEADTKMTLEYATYLKYIRRDINNYVALTDKGKIKFKGALNEDSLKDAGRVIKIAAERYLIHGDLPETTIANDNDITHYVHYMHTKNGATIYHGGQEIGKTARWYWVANGQPILKDKPKNRDSREKVPNGESAALALTLPTTTPSDLNKQAYVDAAWKIIRTIQPLPRKSK